MVLMEFQVKCPECQSMTTLVVQQTSLIIFECSGCGKNIVLQGNRLYTVSRKFVNSIIKDYKSISCGRIVASKVSEEAKNLITDEKINNLHKTLNKYDSVDEILKRL